MMKKVMLLMLIMVMLVGFVSADSITPFSDVTTTAGVGLDALTWEDTEYTTDDLVLGTTIRWYNNTAGGVSPWIPDNGEIPADWNDNGKVDYPGRYADDFLWNSASYNMCSIDNLDFQETTFDVLVDTVFVFENGGNDSGTVYPILQDDTLGPGITLTSGTSYGDCSYSTGQAVHGYVVQTDVLVKGIRIEASGHDTHTVCAIPGTPGLSGKAHSPAPTGDAVNPMELDPDNYGKVSWKDPNTAAQGGDPNLVSVDSYDITYYIVNTDDVTADDPNWARPGQVYYGGTGVSSPYTIAFDDAADTDDEIYWDQTMFWRVDANVTWDSTEITENPVIGDDWQFATRPEYIAPTITTFGSVITAMDLPPTALSAEVETDPISIVNHPLNAPVFTLLTDDLEFPDGASPILTDTTVDYANPTATLDPDQPGLYKVLLEVDDGITFLEALAVVDVYADDCQAAKDAGNWVGANYFDRDGDCFVELEDYSEFAAEWLDDRSMYTQAEDTTPAAYVPADVYENRIETEWAALGPIARSTNAPTGFLDLTTTDMDWVTVGDPDMYGDDPNSCSAWPMWDTDGAPQLRLVEGTTLGYADDVSGARFSNGGLWADYKINVQAVGVPVDIYANFATNGTRVIRLSVVPTPVVYPVDD